MLYRGVHNIISEIQWIRTSRLSVKKFRCSILGAGGPSQDHVLKERESESESERASERSRRSLSQLEVRGVGVQRDCRAKLQLYVHVKEE